jgi:hypothetical protein
MLSNIKRETINGFIRYVYEEVQTEGWNTRKDENIVRQELCVERDVEREFLVQHGLKADCDQEDMTFGKAMERYGVVDEVISEYLYPVLTNHNWMKAWMIQFKPELDKGQYLMMWDALCNFMYGWKITSRIDEVKEMLGLVFELK